MKTMAHHQETEPTQRVDIALIFDDAVDLCLHRFQSHGIQFKKPLFKEPLYVDCRSHQIVQVLVNLMNNAFDAILPLPEKWVQTEVIDRGDMVEVSVMDSGRGISHEVQQKMFNPFYSTKGVQYGTGLGLSISQSILRQNGGYLEYDSQSPYTRFFLLIPKKQSART
jgi:C4-dicarboxylate-specific signal transduction histidine kinase